MSSTIRRNFKPSPKTQISMMKRRTNPSSVTTAPLPEHSKSFVDLKGNSRMRNSGVSSSLLLAMENRTVQVVTFVCFVLFLTGAATSSGRLLFRRSRAFQPTIGTYTRPPPHVVARPTKYETYYKVPELYKMTFFIPHQTDFKLPVMRALRSLGWRLTNDERKAHVVWDKIVHRKRYQELKPWQRYNHIPNFGAWDRKDNFAAGFREYQAKHPDKKLFFLPETFMLGTDEGQSAFERRLENGGMHQPWVLKIPDINNGKGIKMIGGDSEDLKTLVSRVRQEIQELTLRESQDAEEENTSPEDAAARSKDAVKTEKPVVLHKDYIVQTFICNELTWFDHRKFDLRMHWMVASVDPLIVLYTDGFVRVGNAVYDESDFRDTAKHLTTQTKKVEEHKGTMEEYKELIYQHYDANYAKLSKRFKGDPYQHLRNQMKHAIATTIDAFKDKTFGRNKNLIATQNGFSLYGADFIIDQNLDLWYLESQAGPGFIEDYDFKVDLHRFMLRTTFALMQEIQERIEQDPNANVLPFETDLEGWDIVYAGDWMYQYDEYDRPAPEQQCSLAKQPPIGLTPSHEDFERPKLVGVKRTVRTPNFLHQRKDALGKSIFQRFTNGGNKRKSFFG